MWSVDVSFSPHELINTWDFNIWFDFIQFLLKYIINIIMNRLSYIVRSANSVIISIYFLKTPS